MFPKDVLTSTVAVARKCTPVSLSLKPQMDNRFSSQLAGNWPGKCLATPQCWADCQPFIWNRASGGFPPGLFQDSGHSREEQGLDLNQQTWIQILTRPPACGMFKSLDLSKASAVTSRKEGQYFRVHRTLQRSH